MKSLEILEERVVELISELAYLREENRKLKMKVSELESQLSSNSQQIGVMDEQRRIVQERIGKLVRKIEEYQELLIYELGPLQGTFEEKRGGVEKVPRATEHLSLES